MELYGTYNVAELGSPLNIAVEALGGVAFFEITSVKEVQPSNAPPPILVTLWGISILVRPLQPRNAELSIFFTLLGISMLERPLQPSNVLLPMFVTLLGILILERPLQ